MMASRRPGCTFRWMLTGLALLLATGLAGPAARAATPVAAPSGHLYLTTDQAFMAFDPLRAVAPPPVTHFPEAVQYLAAYVSFTGAHPGKTPFRVDFRSRTRTVRRGDTHMLAAARGSYLIDLPGGALFRQGTYQAVLYLGSRVAATTIFSVVKAPIIRTAYLISSDAATRYKLGSHTRPARATAFKAGIKKVGVYLEYRAAARGATLAVVVYDKYGRPSAGTGTHALKQIPTGTSVLLLPAAGGSYPAGSYRADIYFDGAQIASLHWRSR